MSSKIVKSSRPAATALERPQSVIVKSPKPVSSSDHPFDPMLFELHEIEIHKTKASTDVGIFVKEQTIGKGSQPYITRTDAGSPAEKSGIKKGDYVLAVNGHRVDSKPHMAEEVRRVREGVIHLTVARRRPKPLDPAKLKPPGGAPRRPNHNYHLCRMDPMHRPHIGMVLITKNNEVTVESVAIDGLAFWAGLQSRDRLLTIGSETVHDQKQCEELLRKYEGRLVDILIERPADAECSQHSPGLDQHEPLQLQKVHVVSNTVEAGVPEAPAGVTSLLKKRMEGIMKNLRGGMNKRKKKGKEKTKRSHATESAGSHKSGKKKGN